MDNAVNMLTIKCKAFPSLLALVLFSAVAMARHVTVVMQHRLFGRTVIDSVNYKTEK